MQKSAFVNVYKIALIGVAGLFLAGCNQANSEVNEQVIKPVKLFQVPNLIASNHDSFLAEVDAGERSQLSFQVPGVVDAIHVREGQNVEKGDTLIALDSKDYQLAVDAAQAQYDLTETRYKRDTQLISKKLISADTFDQSETAFKAADAHLKEAKTDLSYTQIKAPYSGIISLSFVKSHQFVAAKQPVLNIINNDQLDIEIALPVPYVDKVGIRTLPQREFAVIFDIHNSVIIPAKFKEMSTQPNADTNSYSATVALIRPKKLNILIGMTGKVLIKNESASNSLTLPDDAWLTKEDGKGKVWRFLPETSVVESIDLEVNEFGIVQSGLNSGDMIVVAGAKDLLEGQVVRAWQREGGI